MSVFDEYISKIETDLRGGKATEHTYRGTLEILMESFERGIEASNDPKKYGNSRSADIKSAGNG